jgi:hypothetical protein
LVRQAGQGDVVHNDDTGVKILELMAERARQAALKDADAGAAAQPWSAAKNSAADLVEGADGDSAKEPGPDRTGMFTTGIVATGEGHKIALFLSGRQHAGENLKDVLRRRAAELPSPIQMCDALSAPDVSGWTPKGEHSEHLVDNVVRPWPFGRPPWLGVTLMKCVIHRQDSYPDNVGHWQRSVALAVPLTKVSA